jgi:hypothetical protein
MIVADIYRPEQWADFFLLVGTGAATLTGLIFVAMTINLSAITRDIVINRLGRHFPTMFFGYDT